MDIYQKLDAAAYLSGNEYPGRGVLLGMSPSGKAVLAYFIMGRSDNSRNRVFRAQARCLPVRQKSRPGSGRICNPPLRP